MYIKHHTLSLSKAQANFDCPTSNLILIKFLHKIEIIGTLNEIKVVAPDPQSIIEVKYFNISLIKRNLPTNYSMDLHQILTQNRCDLCLQNIQKLLKSL